MSVDSLGHRLRRTRSHATVTRTGRPCHHVGSRTGSTLVVGKRHPRIGTRTRLHMSCRTQSRRSGTDLPARPGKP
eukprot:947825-Rhodomonas_salina.1